MKLRIFPFLSVCAAMLAFGLAHSNAAVIVNYTFDTNEGNVANTSTSAAKSSAANVTATTFSYGAGASGSSLNSGAPASATDFSTLILVAGTTSISAATARTNSAYGQFTLTMDAGYSLDLRNETVTFELAKGGLASIRQIFLDVSLNGFTTLTPDSINTFTVGGPTTATSNTVYQSVSYNLPDIAAFDSLAGPVSFRLYSFHNANNLSVRVDDIIVNGSVIPEPSAPLMLLSSLGTFALLRRRRA